MIELTRRSAGPADPNFRRLSAAVPHEPAEFVSAASSAIDPAIGGGEFGNGGPPSGDIDKIRATDGDYVNVALTFSTTVGAPEKMRARFVVKTMSGEKLQKLESFIGPDQAREVLMKLLRNDAPDLHRIVARFLADPPQK